MLIPSVKALGQSLGKSLCLGAALFAVGCGGEEKPETPEPTAPAPPPGEEPVLPEEGP